MDSFYFFYYAGWGYIVVFTKVLKIYPTSIFILKAELLKNESG
jgi:hypothetical protein